MTASMHQALAAVNYDDLIGVPYLDHGRTTAGLDCWGLVLLVYARLGLTVPDVFAGQDQRTVRERQEDQPALDWIASLFGAWRRVPQPEPGCAVAIGNVEGAAVHVGVIVEPFRMLHALRKTGVVLSRVDHAPWAEKVLGFYASDR